MNILIIEDEQSSADRLQRMLEGEHQIVVYENAAAQTKSTIPAEFSAMNVWARLTRSALAVCSLSEGQSSIIAATSIGILAAAEYTAV